MVAPTDKDYELLIKICGGLTFLTRHLCSSICIGYIWWPLAFLNNKQLTSGLLLLPQQHFVPGLTSSSLWLTPT